MYNGPGFDEKTTVIAPEAILALTITGINVSSPSGSNTLTLSSGTARDSTDTSQIAIPVGQTRSIDPSTTGAGGLDSGSLAVETCYAVYVSKASNGTVSGILSTAFDGANVSWPGGTTPEYRRVGSVITDENADIQAFVQTGANNDRTMTWQIAMLEKRVVDDENEGSWKFRSMSNLVAPSGETTHTLLKPNTGCTLHIRGAGSGGGPLISVTSETTWGFTPAGSSEEMEFRTSNGDGSVYVMGYLEEV